MVEQYMREISKDTECTIFAKDTGADTPIAERIHQIAPLIPENADFFLINSDTIFDFDIAAMYQKHRSKNALVTLSSVENVSTWGVISIKDDAIVGFARKRKVSRLISEQFENGYGVVNSGLAWVNKSALEYIDLLNVEDLETALFNKVIELGRAAHFRLDGIWYPIDTPKELAAINLNLDGADSVEDVAKSVKSQLSHLEEWQQENKDP